MPKTWLTLFSPFAHCIKTLLFNHHTVAHKTNGISYLPYRRTWKPPWALSSSAPHPPLSGSGRPKCKTPRIPVPRSLERKKWREKCWEKAMMKRYEWGRVVNLERVFWDLLCRCCFKQKRQREEGWEKVMMQIYEWNMIKICLALWLLKEYFLNLVFLALLGLIHVLPG